MKHLNDYLHACAKAGIQTTIIGRGHFSAFAVEQRGTFCHLLVIWDTASGYSWTEDMAKLAFEHPDVTRDIGALLVDITVNRAEQAHNPTPKRKKS